MLEKKINALLNRAKSHVVIAHKLSNCPSCGSSWCGPAIPESQREAFGTQEIAPYFSKLIDAYIPGCDLLNHHECPSCGGRFERGEITEAPADFKPFWDGGGYI